MIVECVEREEAGPPPLLSLASSAVGAQVVRGLWRGKLEFHQTYIPEPLERRLREWIAHLPASLRQELLHRASRCLLLTLGRLTEMSSSTLPILLAALLEVLYCPGVVELEVWTDLHWHQEARMKVLHLLHLGGDHLASGLRRLTFSCYKTPIFQFQALPFSERFLLTNVLNKLHQLTSLVLPYVADDSVLASLGAGACPRLQILDIHGSWEVTNQGVAALAGSGKCVVGRAGWVPSHLAQCTEGQKLLGDIFKGSPVQPSAIAALVSAEEGVGLPSTLLAIHMENTAIDHRGVETALRSFPKLRRLGAEEQHWQALLVGLSRGGRGCRDCYPASLPLTSLNLSRHTYSLLEPLHRLLPNLHRIALSNYERSEAYLDGEDHLPLLGQFPHLAHLVLHDVHLPPVLLHLATSGAGARLTTLDYKSRYKQVEVAELLAACPGLRHLTIEESVLKFTPKTGSHEVYPRVSRLTLRDVTMEGDQTAWRRLTKRCPRLERLTLQNIRLCDADLADLLAPPGLPLLEEVNISSTGVTALTEESVFRLVCSCPSLARVGGVCGWSCSDLLATLEKLSSEHHFKIKMDDRTD